VAELLKKLGVPRWLLLPVPAGVMRLVLQLSGREAYYQRLFEPLQLDTAGSSRALGWAPRHTSENALALTMAWWRQ
jgi:hypothetical protein